MRKYLIPVTITVIILLLWLYVSRKQNNPATSPLVTTQSAVNSNFWADFTNRTGYKPGLTF